jgi:hypothetical protein
LQVTLLLARGAQVWQVGPQAWIVLLGTQVGACTVPPRQKPGVLHSTRQLSVDVVAVSHTAMPSEGGAGHGVHELPQLDGDRSDTHGPVPAGQR